MNDSRNILVHTEKKRETSEEVSFFYNKNRTTRKESGWIEHVLLDGCFDIITRRNGWMKTYNKEDA